MLFLLLEVDMDADERAAVKSRLKEAFRQELTERIHEVEQACQALGPPLSRAEVLRGIKCCVPECVASSIRKEREAGAPIDSDLMQAAIDAFNEVLDELVARAVH